MENADSGAGQDRPRPGEPVDEYVCGVCGRALDYVIDRNAPSPGHWAHSGWDQRIGGEGSDHRVVPVRRGEIASVDRCDFCLVDHPAWRIPVRPFQADEVYTMNSDWLACETCGALVERDQWNALLRRAVAAWEQRHHAPCPPELEVGMKSLYRQVRKNITGSAKRVEG